MVPSLMTPPPRDADSEEKEPTPPPSVDTASALMKISKSKSFPTAPPSSTEEQIVDRKPIQYETGYDPLTGEVKVS